MPKTLEQIQKEKQELKEETGVGKGEGLGEGRESIADVDETFEEFLAQFRDWVIATPDELKEEVEEKRREKVEEAMAIQNDLANTVNVDLPGLAFDLQSVEDAIDRLGNDLPDDLTTLTTEQLLANILDVLLNAIAPSINSAAQLLQVVSTAETAQLATLFDIDTEVSPSSTIVVTGNNAVDTAEEPEPVVQESNNTGIPTRELILKADEDNQDPLAFGDDQVDPDNAFLLKPGESTVINHNIAQTVLYFTSETEGDQLQILGLL